MIELKDIASMTALNEAYYECSKVCKWKESVQRYGSNLLLNNVSLRNDLLNGTYKVLPTTDFELMERGKVRKIEAPQIRDRIVQKVLMKKVLLPELTPKLIYDNYASLKGRGTDMARKRMNVMLQRYIRKHGTDGYILLVDIRKYFESIDHDVLKTMIRKDLKNVVDDDVMHLIEYLVDCSSHSNRGLNLGSENPQIYAVYYLHKLDNFVKIIKQKKYYGRYMDDMAILGGTKEELRELLSDIENILHELGLEINRKKTQIVKLSHGFTWLQVKYNITDSGHIIKRLVPKKIVREKRRLKAFRRLVDNDKMQEIDVLNCYLSWRGSTIKSCNACYRSIKSIDELYKRLFGNRKPPINGNIKSRTELINKIFNQAEACDMAMATNTISYV